jgi:Rod binding domain-containing protein
MRWSPTDGAARRLCTHLEKNGSDLLREMLEEFAEQLMSADAQGLCNVGYGDVSPSGSTSATAIEPREMDTRVSIHRNDPKAATGRLLPGVAPRARCRAEQALTQVVYQCQWKECLPAGLATS